MSAGGDYGMKLAGAYAVDTLRLEKGFRHWGHELDTETTPWEAGLAFAVDMNKVQCTVGHCMNSSAQNLNTAEPNLHYWLVKCWKEGFIECLFLL